MSSRILTCACGHSWEYTEPHPVPDDLSTICPVCSAGEPTLHHPSNTDGPAKAPSEQTGPGLALSPPGFEILEELNRGGMGVIYKARQTGLNRVVALKVISPERLGDPEFMRRFRREVEAAALLSHANIVTVFATDLDGPLPFLAMEFVPGIDLFRLVKQVGPLSVEDACSYIQQAAQGLQHALEKGLVHRDIKPANLMVTPSPLDRSAGTSGSRVHRIKILDMGLARVTVAAEGSAEAGSLTQAGAFLGTPDFISPEQAEDSRRADIRSDLYSLGATFYFLLVGGVPFAGTNLIQKVRRQLTEPPPSVTAQRQDVPAAVDAVVRKLMACEPGDRFQTPAELIEALERIMHPRPGPAPAAVRETSVPPSIQAVAPAKAPASACPVSQARAHEGGVQALSLSGDGQLLLSGGQDELLRLWDAARLRQSRLISDDVGPVQDVCLAPGGKWAASCALRLLRADMVVQIWDVASGNTRRRLGGQTDNLHCLAISSDGRRVAAGSADQTALVWALDQPGFPSVCLKGHAGPVSCVRFIPGGDTVLTGSHDGMLRVWDARSGTIKATLNCAVGKLLALAFGGSSKRIAVAGSSLRIRQGGGTFTDVNGHQGPILCLAFSADGSMLVSGGSDGTVRLWRAEDGEELRCLTGHQGAVRGVAVSPDGRVVFSGGVDGTIRRWAIPG
jgi:WD40 repeat protein/serine/threonine protein kinase